MGGWSDKILEFIRSDYREWGEESCLYQFLEQEKARKGKGALSPEKLNGYARDWIYNRGKSVKGGDGAVRSAGIPIGLVERCLLRSPDLRQSLGLGGVQRAGGGLSDDDMRTKGRDLERLYHSIVSSGSDCSGLVVPVEIDGASGMGLYLLGCGFANRSRSAVVRMIFDRPAWPVNDPFLVIMRHHWNMADLAFKPVGPDGRSFSFWDDVVTAWVPKERNFGFNAYVRFNSDEELEESLLAYALNNESVEKLADCPERFRKYFET